MKLLTANTTYNVDQLAERLQMSRRTVYRYIDTFREAGFVIKKSGDCIRLDKESPHFRDISQLVHFTEEEAVILKNAIENIDDTNMLKQKSAAPQKQVGNVFVRRFPAVDIGEV